MPEIIFNGPAGRLEARYHHSNTQNAPLALVLHPSPEHGGTMNNKNTYLLYQAMVARGFTGQRRRRHQTNKPAARAAPGITTSV